MFEFRNVSNIFILTFKIKKNLFQKFLMYAIF